MNIYIAMIYCDLYAFVDISWVRFRLQRAVMFPGFSLFGSRCRPKRGTQALEAKALMLPLRTLTRVAAKF